ncbi:unnamed protein product [Cochlearia groenlandica]
MFLRVFGHNEVQRDIGLRFGRNQEFVKRKFGELLRATELLSFDYIKTPTIEELRRFPQHLQTDEDIGHVLVDLLEQWMALMYVYWSRHDRPKSQHNGNL